MHLDTPSLIPETVFSAFILISNEMARGVSIGMSTEVTEMESLSQSYAHCVALSKKEAKHFHYGFQLLADKDRYQSICALYAFARLADDFSDDDDDAERALENAREWRRAFDRAMDGDPSAHLIMPAVVDSVRKYKIPVKYFHELMTGTEMDARQNRYTTWEDSYGYCYRVASVIGLMTIHVFGFEDPQHETGSGEGRACELAEKTGIAFQMTNIVRDIKEDAERDRIYLPLEDLKRFGITEDQLLAGKHTPEIRELVKFEVERAHTYYEAAPELVPMIHKGSRRALSMMVKVYQGLLKEIERRDYDVLTERVSLSKAQKLALAGGALLKGL